MSPTMLIFVALLLSLQPSEAQIGVCYGRLGNNLPSQQDVVNFYNSNGIAAMRIYDPDQATLNALQGSGIRLILGVPNQDIPSLGSDGSTATRWVQANVVPFASSIKYIAVGNEVHPSYNEASYVALAMQNIQNALNSFNLRTQIKVSTAIDMTLIKNSSPPSSGTFTDMSYMAPIIKFLKNNDSPLLANIYPYFAYINDKENIELSYALLDSDDVIVDDGNQLEYQSLFDAMVDSVYAALAKAGAPNTAIVVSETGWPSDGGDSATVHNAEVYYSNVISYVQHGTPMKPGESETYLFAMFDENQKPGAPSEQHFGLFTANKQPKYKWTVSSV